MNKDFNEFMKYYKKGEIVYPSAIARYLKISLKEAYKKCDNYLELKKIYVVTCPCCNKVTSIRYYAIVDIPLGIETGCVHCDSIFEITMDNCITIYEKM